MINAIATSRMAATGQTIGTTKRSPELERTPGEGEYRKEEEREDGRREEVVIRIPISRLQEVMPRLFHNSIIVSFVGAVTEGQAKSWIEAFNESSRYQLRIGEALINSLFTATIEGGGSKKSLVKKPYRKAGNRFATVNDYHSAFDPQCPIDFNYLVTVVIRKGSPKIFELLDDIFHPFGTVADRDIAPGVLHHMITVLLATKERSFVRYVKVELARGRSIYVDFDFFEDHMRCSICFSLEHTIRQCEVRPRRYAPSTSTTNAPARSTAE